MGEKKEREKKRMRIKIDIFRKEKVEPISS